MAAKETASNPLVTSKAPDAPVNVQLHPLVLLTISDYITRHTLRSQQGPIVGAIIGQQNGRSFTLEHAYECKLAQHHDEVMVDSQWFSERLEQYHDVHKAPALDLVAMFTMGPLQGPQPAHLAMMRQVQQLTGTDGIMLLLFHPELVDHLQGGKLPISLWESVQEQEGEEVQMRYRELSFEVETGEAEMIGVDFVAKGGGNAAAVGNRMVSAPPAAASSPADASKTTTKKGKTRAKEKEAEEAEASGSASATNFLSPEDEELIASLTAKANAIKMLNQRLSLIRMYLSSLPSSYLTDATSSTPPPLETTNYSVLRSINAMLARLSLLASPSASDTTEPTHRQSETSLQSASAREKQDVHLTSLLATLTRSVHEAQAMGAKFAVVQKEKATKERHPGFGGGGRGPGAVACRHEPLDWQISSRSTPSFSDLISSLDHRSRNRWQTTGRYDRMSNAALPCQVIRRAFGGPSTKTEQNSSPVSCFSCISNPPSWACIRHSRVKPEDAKSHAFLVCQIPYIPWPSDGCGYMRENNGGVEWADGSCMQPVVPGCSRALEVSRTADRVDIAQKAKGFLLHRRISSSPNEMRKIPFRRPAAPS
nr:cop9 signalosome complex subunit 6 [Quercus suber]